VTQGYGWIPDPNFTPYSLPTVGSPGADGLTEAISGAVVQQMIWGPTTQQVGDAFTFFAAGLVAANNGATISAANNGILSKLKSLANNPCVTSALAKGALSVGVDAIGLIPEAGGVARVIGHQAGFVGVVADQAGSRIVKAVGASTSTAQGLNGLFDTSPEGLVSTGLTVAGFIPGFGQAASIGSIILDTYKTAKAIGQCH